MLQLIIPSIELFDDETLEFSMTKEYKLQLEHSLVSLSKWESKWHKPFLSTKKTPEEMRDYIRCMTLTQNVKPEIYYYLSAENIDQVDKYIGDPMTASWFSEDIGNTKSNDETVTSELIYYWMITFRVPFECQKWHLNRLITLIKICSLKNSPPKKIGRNEQLARNRALNEARRKALNTTG